MKAHALGIYKSKLGKGRLVPSSQFTATHDHKQDGSSTPTAAIGSAGSASSYRVPPSTPPRSLASSFNSSTSISRGLLTPPSSGLLPTESTPIRIDTPRSSASFGTLTDDDYYTLPSAPNNGSRSLLISSRSRTSLLAHAGGGGGSVNRTAPTSSEKDPYDNLAEQLENAIIAKKQQNAIIAKKQHSNSVILAAALLIAPSLLMEGLQLYTGIENIKKDKKSFIPGVSYTQIDKNSFIYWVVGTEIFYVSIQGTLYFVATRDELKNAITLLKNKYPDDWELKPEGYGGCHKRFYTYLKVSATLTCDFALANALFMARDFHPILSLLLASAAIFITYVLEATQVIQNAVAVSTTTAYSNINIVISEIFANLYRCAVLGVMYTGLPDAINGIVNWLQGNDEFDIEKTSSFEYTKFLFLGLAYLRAAAAYDFALNMCKKIIHALDPIKQVMGEIAPITLNLGLAKFMEEGIKQACDTFWLGEYSEYIGPIVAYGYAFVSAFILAPALTGLVCKAKPTEAYQSLADQEDSTAATPLSPSRMSVPPPSTQGLSTHHLSAAPTNRSAPGPSSVYSATLAV